MIRSEKIPHPLIEWAAAFKDKIADTTSTSRFLPLDRNSTLSAPRSQCAKNTYDGAFYFIRQNYQQMTNNKSQSSGIKKAGAKHLFQIFRKTKIGFTGQGAFFSYKKPNKPK